MKTVLEKSIAEKEREEQTKEEKEHFAFHIVEAKKYVPEIQQIPFVKVPLGCKLGLHQFHWFYTDIILSTGPMLSDVRICAKCGVVVIEHLRHDPFHVFSMATDEHYMGYGNPNKPLDESRLTEDQK